MLLKMTLQAEKPSFCLPIHYNYLLQSALYRLLDPDFARFLHNEGYMYGKRSFRLFTFSQLLGKYRLIKEQKQICFQGQVKLRVHSPLAPFCQSIMNTLLLEEGIRLGQARLNVIEIECTQPDINKDTLLVQTLSPITVYSTMFRPDGRKFTHYYQPRDSEFSEHIRNNLLKKFELVYQSVPSSTRLHIEPLGQTKERIVLYKGFVIKGHIGQFQLWAEDRRLLSLALDAGIGSKGSQGFGCVEPVASSSGGDQINRIG